MKITQLWNKRKFAAVNVNTKCKSPIIHLLLFTSIIIILFIYIMHYFFVINTWEMTTFYNSIPLWRPVQ